MFPIVHRARAEDALGGYFCNGMPDRNNGPRVTVDANLESHVWQRLDHLDCLSVLPEFSKYKVIPGDLARPSGLSLLFAAAVSVERMEWASADDRVLFHLASARDPINWDLVTEIFNHSRPPRLQRCLRARFARLLYLGPYSLGLFCIEGKLA